MLRQIRERQRQAVKPLIELTDWYLVEWSSERDVWQPEAIKGSVPIASMLDRHLEARRFYWLAKECQIVSGAENDPDSFRAVQGGRVLADVRIMGIQRGQAFASALPPKVNVSDYELENDDYEPAETKRNSPRSRLYLG